MMKKLILTLGFTGAILLGFQPSIGLAHEDGTRHSHDIKSPDELARDARKDFRQEIKRREREQSKNQSFYTPPSKDSASTNNQMIVKPKSTTNKPSSLWNN